MSRQERLKNAPVLEPCPGCKIVPCYVGSDTYRDWGIECQNLECPVIAELENKYKTPEAAAKAWNNIYNR